MTTIPAPKRQPATTASQTDSARDILDALAPLLAHQRRRWAANCQAHGLSIVGFHVMALLEERDGLTMSQLADELDVALPNATGIVDRMARRGLVERADDPDDRRVVRVRLTEAGHSLVAEMESARSHRMSRLLALLDSSQQRRLLEAVRDLHAAAERLTEGEEER